MKNILSIFICVKFILINQSFSASPEYQLKQEIFRNRKYDKRVRPKINPDEAIQLNVSLSIVQLLDLSVKHEQIKLMSWMYLHWFDEFLTWNPKDYQNITQTVIPIRQLWQPDFYLYNSVDQINWNSRVNTPVKVSYDGKIHWNSPATFVASCNVSNKFYPFDTQTCTLRFGTWTSSAKLLDVYSMSESVSTDHYQVATNWLLLQTKIRRKKTLYFGEEYDPGGTPYVDIYFDFVYKRAKSWGMTNFVWPVLLLGMMLMSLFMFPADSGEKVSFACMTFLTFMVVNQSISEDIPRSEEVREC